MALYEDEHIHSFAYKRREKNVACKILKLLSDKVVNGMGLLSYRNHIYDIALRRKKNFESFVKLS